MSQASSSTARAAEEEMLKAVAATLQVQPLWTPTSDQAVGIEIVHLLHLLIDEYLPWSAKVEAARLIALARAQDSLDVLTEGEAGAAEQAVGSAYAGLYTALLQGGCDALELVLSPPEDPRIRRNGPAYGGVWKAALCGLIPALIHSLEEERLKRMTAPNSQELVSQATTAFLERATPRLVEIEALMARDDQAKPAQAERREDDMALDEWFESNSSPQAAPLRCSLLRAIVDVQLAPLDAFKASSIGEALQEMEVSLTVEAGGQEQLASYLSQRLQGEELDELLSKIASDYGVHHAFAQQVRHIFSTAVESSDLEALSRLCKALLDNPAIVDILLLYVTPAELLRPFAELLDKPDLGEIADQSAVLGSTLLFAQWLLQRAELSGPSTCDELAQYADFLPRFMRSTPTSVGPLGDLDAAERELVDRWIQALYDSEGISDDLMRASSPQALLRLAPLLFSQSIRACLSGVIDLETLKGGLAYFTQELLSFALPGALLWVIADVKRVPFRTLPPAPGGAAPAFTTSRSVHYDVLALFLTSESCPAAVKQIIAPEMYTALNDDDASIVIDGLDVQQADILSALGDARKSIAAPWRSSIWLSALLTTSLPPQTLTSHGHERHAHLIQALARAEPISDLVARHFLELLCSTTAATLLEARTALQRSLACLLAFDALRTSVRQPGANVREWSLVKVAAWAGKLRAHEGQVGEMASFWNTLVRALKALQECAATSDSVLQREQVDLLWAQVAQLMALATVQASVASPNGLAGVAPTLVSATKTGSPSSFLESLTLVFPALASLHAS